jgi:hypothetical protein
MRFGALYLLLQAIGASAGLTSPTIELGSSLAPRQASAAQVIIGDTMTECAPIRVSWTWPGAVPPFSLVVL